NLLIENIIQNKGRILLNFSMVHSQKCFIIKDELNEYLITNVSIEFLLITMMNNEFRNFIAKKILNDQSLVKYFKNDDTRMSDCQNILQLLYFIKDTDSFYEIKDYIKKINEEHFQIVIK